MKPRVAHALFTVLLALFLSACLESADSQNQSSSSFTEQDRSSMVLNEAEALRLNHIQVLGSHNSYKSGIDPLILAVVGQGSPKHAVNLNYSHPPITTQLEYGLRQLEIDIVKDSIGGRYAQPKGELLTGQTRLSVKQRADLNEPGFKVMHIPDIDFESHCILFRQCLMQLKEYSDQHPNHLPIMVMMNLKDTTFKEIQGVSVLPFETADYAELDAEIKNVLGPQLITPDEIRGDANTLRQAVLDNGWPKLDEMRGRFMFILDGKDYQLAAYKRDHPSLSGRALFAPYSSEQAEAAVMIINDPVSNYDLIQQRVREGFLIRTRSDGSMSDVLNNDHKVSSERIEKAFSSGAHFVSTDLYPNSPQKEQTNLIVGENLNQFYQCNPLLINAICSLSE